MKNYFEPEIGDVFNPHNLDPECLIDEELVARRTNDCNPCPKCIFYSKETSFCLCPDSIVCETNNIYFTKNVQVHLFDADGLEMVPGDEVVVICSHSYERYLRRAKISKIVTTPIKKLEPAQYIKIFLIVEETGRLIERDGVAYVNSEGEYPLKFRTIMKANN